jgi:hypothetical protein
VLGSSSIRGWLPSEDCPVPNRLRLRCGDPPRHLLTVSYAHTPLALESRLPRAAPAVVVGQGNVSRDQSENDSRRLVGLSGFR